MSPLIGSRLLVLLSIANHPKTIQRVAEEVSLSKETVRRIAWALRELGAVNQVGNTLIIPPQDAILKGFLQDFSKGACAAVLESIEPTGTVLWSEGLEFVFSARKPVKEPGVRETGITAMAKHGLPFVSDTRYYFYAYWRRKLKREEVALHQILADPTSTRNISYALLFLRKEGYSRTSLSKLGDAVGAREIADQIADYLDGKPVKNPRFPSLAEMENLRVEYGVR